MTDVVLSDGEVGQVDKIPKLVVHHPDPVEPHVECGEAGQLVDHRRDLREPVVAAVEDPEDLEVCQLLRQGCDHVLRKRQRFQVPQESYLRRKSGESEIMQESEPLLIFNFNNKCPREIFFLKII